jgi:hypothetical protein
LPFFFFFFPSRELEFFFLKMKNFARFAGLPLAALAQSNLPLAVRGDLASGNVIEKPPYSAIFAVRAEDAAALSPAWCIGALGDPSGIHFRSRHCISSGDIFNPHVDCSAWVDTVGPARGTFSDLPVPVQKTGLMSFSVEVDAPNAADQARFIAAAAAANATLIDAQCGQPPQPATLRSRVVSRIGKGDARGAPRGAPGASEPTGNVTFHGSGFEDGWFADGPVGQVQIGLATSGAVHYALCLGSMGADLNLARETCTLVGNATTCVPAGAVKIAGAAPPTLVLGASDATTDVVFERFTLQDFPAGLNAPVYTLLYATTSTDEHWNLPGNFTAVCGEQR